MPKPSQVDIATENYMTSLTTLPPLTCCSAVVHVGNAAPSGFPDRSNACNLVNTDQDEGEPTSGVQQPASEGNRELQEAILAQLDPFLPRDQGKP